MIKSLSGLLFRQRIAAIPEAIFAMSITGRTARRALTSSTAAASEIGWLANAPQPVDDRLIRLCKCCRRHSSGPIAPELGSHRLALTEARTSRMMTRKGRCR